MKYLDNTGLAYFKGKLDTELATKQDSLVSGTNIKTINNESLLGSGDISVATTSDIPTKTSDLTNDSGFIDGLEILSYGNSTWNDFITAYQKNKVVYCRASSNSNPASGSQTRLAFMAYVNNATSPTEVEFQYYRSVSSHSDSQQGDQVYVYKLTSSGNWTVTVRNAFSKVVAGTGLSSSYSSGAITLSANAQTETDPVFTASAASSITSSNISSWDGKQDALVSGTNIKTINNESLLGSGNITIQGGGSPTWGNITGTLSNQTDLQSVLDSKMPVTDITDSTVRVYELDTGLYRIMGTSTNPINVYWKSGGYSFEVSSTEYLLLTINENATAYHFLTTRGTYFYEGYVSGSTSGFNKVLSDRDIKDVLTSTDTKSVLSANQGKILNESKQDTLVSGTNIKTINGDSILGSGNISVGGEKIPIGTIFEFPTDDPTKLPTGYLFCDGSAVSRTTYADLFGVIGTTYGSGDGSTTFNLPSKEGLVTVGIDSNDTSFDTIGETGGEKTHTLSVDEMPSHNHAINYAYPFNSGGLGTYLPATNQNTPTGQSPTDIKPTGGGQAHNNLQPYVVSNYIIKAANVSQLPDEAEVVDGYSTSTTDAYSANYINNMILNAVYPVGSIYMSINSTSPATLFGGTWEAISQGRTLVGVGTGTDINGDSMTWTAEAEGGEYLHTLTVNEMPSHSHSTVYISSFSGGNQNTRTGYGYNEVALNRSSYGNSVANTGGGQAHNNIQPFFAVYMWKRTA